MGVGVPAGNMTGLVVRPATAADLSRFSDMSEKPTIKAVVGEIDGKLIAVGGFTIIKGRYYAFLDLTDDARKYKIAVGRTARRLFDMAKRDGIKFVYAEVDANEATAKNWLARLGFEPDTRSGVLYRWSAK